MAKKTKGKNTWADHYTRKAQKEGYAARSVYKLMEIQKKFNVIKKKSRVLDLGCAPGSWLVYAAQTTGPDGFVVGIDLKEVKLKDLPAHVAVLRGDLLSPDEAVLEATAAPFDVVLSDMAPATVGNKFTDAVRSAELSRSALAVARKTLKPNGTFVVKIFQGEEFEAFHKEMKTCFKIVKNFRPDGTRKASNEIYIIGKELK